MEQFLIGLAGSGLFVCAAWPFMKRRKASRFAAALMFIGGCCLIVGSFGSMIESLTSWIPNALLGVLCLGLLLVLGIGLFLDAKDGKVDKPGQWIAFALPVIIVLAPGNFGDDVVRQIGQSGNGVVSSAGVNR